MKHKANVLTSKEVEDGRSNAYKYLDMDNLSLKEIRDIKSEFPVPYERIIGLCPEDRSPIFYADVDYYIIKKKQKTKFTAERIVFKGTFEEAKTQNETKKRILNFHFRGTSSANKKVAEFDLSRVEIREFYLRKYLGNGIK